MEEWKYIPYPETYNPDMFYDNKKLMSYNLPITIVIGPRRGGKTFRFKKMVVQDFINRNRPFVWLRDNDEARKNLSMNNGDRFFKDFNKMKIKGFEKGSIIGQKFVINGKDAGALMPCSTFQNYKGNDFSDIYTVVYDEFIRELNRNKTKAEAWEIINSLYTILSTRKNCRIVMLANALDRGNAFLQLINCQLDKYGYYVNKSKGIVLEYCNTNPKFYQEQKESVVGKLIQKTHFEDNLFGASFTDDTSLYFIKLPPKSKLLLILNGYVNIRIYYNNNMWFASNDINPQAYTNKRYAGRIEDVTSTLSYVGAIFIKNALEMYANNNIKFSSPFLKKAFCELIGIR